MIEHALTVEILLRGMAIGVSLLTAASLLSIRPLNWRRGLGGLFAIAASSYVVIASPSTSNALGFVFPVALAFAYFAPIFFWWFALALFDDRFRWRWALFLPFFIKLLFIAGNVFFETNSLATIFVTYIWRITIVFIYAHAIFIALRYASDDLIEGRRRFRTVFAASVAFLGLIIVYVETTGLDRNAPHGLMLAQAVAILLLTGGFAVWVLTARNETLDGRDITPALAPDALREIPAKPMESGVDQAAYKRLQSLMADEIWRHEGLSVARLAEQASLPEHQLRRLINRELGFRNFSAFLNSYRIEAAKKALADPDQARKQVLQIALEVGYGSIAPFNRAFKDAVRMTPTEFRKQTMNSG